MKIKIVIGDWSGDGHGESCAFLYECNKSIEEVREAYFKAKKLHPDICPENYNKCYADSILPPKIEKKLRKLGCPLPEEDLEDDFEPEMMANIVCWFIKLGDPEITLSDDAGPDNTLHFYGMDDKKRHIDFIGYGLFLD